MLDSRKRSERFEFKKDERNGYLIGPDGCNHVTEGSALFAALECTCGCGCPEEQHEFIKDALGNFNRDGVAWESAGGVKGLEALVSAQPDKAAEFIAHVLSNERLIEYGGSVYGAWLTDRGRQYRESDGYKDFMDEAVDD